MQLFDVHEEGQFAAARVTRAHAISCAALTIWRPNQFNTGTAKHTFCRHCGIHAFYQPRTDPENYSVNARCLDDYDPAVMQPRRLFDGRNWEEAFARHQAEWQTKP